MKFVISLLTCLLMTSAMASPIKIFYEDHPEKAQVVREIFINEYQIPMELFSLIKTENCENTKGSRKLDLCLKNNGDLIVVSVDHRFISDSLKVFQAP